MKKKNPIVIFPYSRPQHLQMTLEALGRCEGYDECALYMFCDAPQKEKDFIAVEATRAVAKAWSKLRGGTVIEREHNFGLRNITEGISQICREYGRIIVVEEDIIVAPDFLRFMTQSLDQYEQEERVKIVSGFMYADCHPKQPSTFFLPSAFIWGWGTWQRVWKDYSWQPEGWQEFLNDKERCHRFNYRNGRSYSDMLKRAVTCNPPFSYTWDVQLSFQVFNQGGLVLYPWRSLVWNAGIGCGLHGKSRYATLDGREKVLHGSMSMDDFLIPRLESWEYPKELAVDEEAYDRVCRTLKRDKWRKKIARWKKRLIEKVYKYSTQRH